MKAIASLTAFIILASECELTLTNIIVKIAALIVLAGTVFLVTREPAQVPRRRMQ